MRILFRTVSNTVELIFFLLDEFDEHNVRLESLVAKNEKAISSFGEDKLSDLTMGRGNE